MADDAELEAALSSLSPQMRAQMEQFLADGTYKPEDVIEFARMVYVGEETNGSDTPTAQPSLEDILSSTAMSVTGSEALRGEPLHGPLPPWVRQDPNLRQLVKREVIDPYFGTPEAEGDDRVYMGQQDVFAGFDLSKVEGPKPGDHPEPETPIPGPKRSPKEQARFDRLMEQLGEDTDKKGRAGVGGSIGPVSGSAGADREDLAASGALLGGVLGQSSTTKKDDRSMSRAVVMNLPYTWDEPKIVAAIQRMRAAGFDVENFDDLNSLWGNLVDRATMIYGTTQGEKKVTPWDVLDMYKSEAQAAGTFEDLSTNMDVGQYGSEGFTGAKKMTSKSVSTLSEGEAWASLQSTLSRMLGRDPTDEELREFTYRMNHMAARNPSISKTITRYKNGEAVSSSTHSSAGFTAADVAQQAYEEAQNDPEYAEYQSASTYFNAALSALGAIGEG